VLPPGDRYRAEAIDVLLPGAKAEEVLLPGNRRRAEAINVLLPGNAGGGSKRNAVIRAKIIKGVLLLKRRLQRNIITGKIL